MKYEEVRIFTTNKSKKKIKPQGVLLHHTGDYSLDSVLNTFLYGKASCHVLIKKDGTRIILGEDTDRMWHAGVSEWRWRKNCNNYLLGVEFHGDTHEEPLTEDQVESFIEWFTVKQMEYEFAYDMVIDHKRVAPDRKTDMEEEEYQRVFYSISHMLVPCAPL